MSSSPTSVSLSPAKITERWCCYLTLHSSPFTFPKFRRLKVVFHSYSLSRPPQGPTWINSALCVYKFWPSKHMEELTWPNLKKLYLLQNSTTINKQCICLPFLEIINWWWHLFWVWSLTNDSWKWFHLPNSMSSSGSTLIYATNLRLHLI